MSLILLVRLSIKSKMLNYWKHVIPKNYKNFKFTSEIQTNKDFENLKPIFILGLPRSG